MHKLVYLFFFLTFCTLLTGQNTAIHQDSLKVDRSDITKRTFPEDFKSAYNGKAYNYDQAKASKGWFTRFKEWLADWFDSLFDFENPVEANDFTDLVMKIVFALIFIAVIFIIVKLIMNKEGRWFIGKSAEKGILNVEDIENNIHIIDFKSLINDVKAAGDYRSAIRYYYLWLLKELTNKGHIDYDIEKTNNDYLQELRQTAYQKDFNYASYLYNYIWYGEFEVDQVSFQKAASKFDELINSLKQ